MIDSFQFLVPVIVIFTKFDALYDIEYAKLKCEGVSRKDANELAPKHVRESFATGPQVKLLYDPDGNRRPPKCHVCLPGKLIKHQIAIERLIICIRHVDMDKDGADCGPLLERTTEALDDTVLQKLLLSTQQTNLTLSIMYGLRR
jgi:hypothetical protein